MAERNFTRHTLAYVAPQAWSAVVAGEDDPLLLGWTEAGRPAIVRRPDCSDRGDIIPLGVPLPPAQGKRRVSLRCRADDIVRIDGPPLLHDAALAAPPQWQISITRLLALAPDVACFGSLAWTYLTGLPYMSKTSDLDLIFKCSSSEEAYRIARGLLALTASSPMRIDAELVTPSGEAVHWREWESDASHLLVKSMAYTRLQERHALFHTAISQ